MRRPLGVGRLVARASAAAALAVVAVTLLGARAGDDGQPVELRRRFVPGQSHYYTIQVDESQRQTFLPLVPAMISKRQTIHEFVERIKGAPGEGTATVEWVLERVRFSRSDEKGDVRYDSLADPAPAEMRAAAGLINQSLVIARQAPCGKYGSAAGGAASRPAQAASSPAAPQAAAPTLAPATAPARRPPTPRRGAAAAAGLYDRTTLMHLLATLTTEFLPAAPVAVGQTWTVELREPQALFGVLVHEVRWTLRGIELYDGRRTALLTATGQTRLEAPASSASSNASSHKAELRRGAISAEARFDLGRGRLDQMVVRQDYDLHSETRLKGDAAMTVSAGVLMQREIRLTASDEAPLRPIVVKTTQPATIRPPAAQRVAPRVPASQAVRRHTTRPAQPPANRAAHPPTSRPARAPAARPPNAAGAAGRTSGQRPALRTPITTRPAKPVPQKKRAAEG